MSTINLTLNVVSYTWLLTDKSRFLLHNLPIIMFTMCTFSYKVFIASLLYFINYYDVVRRKNFAQ